MHNALDDAIVTADLYREMIGGGTIQKIKTVHHEAKKPTAMMEGLQMKRIVSVCIAIIMFLYSPTVYALPNTQSVKEAAKKATGNVSDKAKEAKGKLSESVEKASDTAQNTADKLTDAASTTKDNAKEKAEQVGSAVSNGAKQAWTSAQDLYAKINTEKFKRGWNYVAKLAGSRLSAIETKEFAEQVGKIADRITDLEVDINKSAKNNRASGQEKGFIFEKWHADTFNIDAAAKNKSDIAWRKESQGYASVDIETSSGNVASLKAYSDAIKNAKEQAQSGKSAMKIDMKDYVDNHLSPEEAYELVKAKYEGQQRVIPEECIPDAKEYLEGKIKELEPLNDTYSEAQQRRYKETLDNLKDHVEANGVESKPLNSEDLKAITELSEEGKFEAEKFNIKLSNYITRADILKEIVKPGAQAAMLRAALTVGPDIYSIIVDAARNGNIDEDQLKKAGLDAVLSGSEGFVEGSVSSAILLACKAGKFGSALKKVSPDTVAMLTILTIDAARYGYQLANGEITPLEYTDIMAEESFVAIVSQVTGVSLALLLPAFPLAYLAGSMAGSMLATAGYEAGKETLLAVKDAEGLGTILPADFKAFDVGKEYVASLDMKEKISSIKDFSLTTMKNGTIAVKL